MTTVSHPHDPSNVSSKLLSEINDFTDQEDTFCSVNLFSKSTYFAERVIVSDLEKMEIPKRNLETKTCSFAILTYLIDEMTSWHK